MEEEWPVFWSDGDDLCLFALEGGERRVEEVCWRPTASGTLGDVSLKQSGVGTRRVAQWMPQQGHVAVGVLTREGFYLNRLAHVAVVSPSVPATDEKDKAWTLLTLGRQPPSQMLCQVAASSRFQLASLVSASGEAELSAPLPGSRHSIAGDATLSLRDKVSRLLDRSAIVNWSDACRFVGSSDRAVLNATLDVARLVRGAWIRKAWKSNCSKLDQLAWSYLLWLFASQGSVKRARFVEEAKVTSAVATEMLQAVAVRVGACQAERVWVLRIAPDLGLFDEYPQLLSSQSWTEEDGVQLRAAIAAPPVVKKAKRRKVRAAASQAPDVAARSGEEAAGMVTQLLRQHGVVAELELRSWAQRMGISWDVVEATGERRGAVLFSLKKSLISEHNAGLDARFAEYFEIALALLLESKSHKVSKKALVAAFKQAGLPEPKAPLFRAVISSVATAQDGQWMLKTGFFIV